MALLYPWATKEYLLWEMSIGQIILYHNLGLEIKYPKPPTISPAGKPLVAANKSPKELKRIRQELRDQVSQQENEKQKQQWRTKYGDI